MAVITAKIISVTSKGGIATIVVELDDGAGKWQKIYTQSQENIKAQNFKDMVAADVRGDLNVKTQLLEISPLVGKLFSFTV